MAGHKASASISQNRKAELANAYNELGKELSSSKIRVVGNYTLGRVIGEGAYGKVRLGIHRLTSTRVAIKQIPKAVSASLTREIHHHRQLHHPHITQMYEVIATESHIWIVTELCCGGELFDYLVEKGRLSEDETRLVFGQLCLAVSYLHDNNIVHRDLKLENVLLDERCRVKLGDFGFTREFDRNALMETFCGTTGYASPEMLQGKKYQGPEVDVWSLGIILYTLLTGTLPFDDDDETVMREKIIEGEFEDPTWLSLESRDLIKNILTKDVQNRITIPQILAHPWFTARTLSYEGEPLSPLPILGSGEMARPVTPPQTTGDAPQSQSRRNSNSEASTQESASTSPFTRPELISSIPTTPDKEVLIDPFDSTDNKFQSSPTSGDPESGLPTTSIPRHPSDATIRTTTLESLATKFRQQTATVVEEDSPNETFVKFPVSASTPSPIVYSGSTSSKPSGPTLPIRTPARTKRRSVSSIMSDGAAGANSPVIDVDNDVDLGIDMGVTTGLSLNTSAAISSQPVDFASLLNANMPVMFSTEPERRLLNSLAALGLDTAQIVHSVLSHACDSAGAMWWMLRRKDREREENGGVFVVSPVEEVKGIDFSVTGDKEQEKPKGKEKEHKKKRHKVSAGVQTDARAITPPPPPPQFALVPPTPTMASGRPTTPPPRERVATPTRTPLLSPSSTTAIPNAVYGGDTSGSASYRSYPSTPSGSVKDRDKENGHVNGKDREKDRDKDKGGRKPRSGSVSIMQRATTALEAAGLVRKKSTEAVKEERDRDREKSKEAEREKEKRIGSNEESRPSHGSTSGSSSKLTKSPPLKPAKDPMPIPSTPPPTEHSHATTTQIGSPWVLADSGATAHAEVAREVALATLTGTHTTVNTPQTRDPMVHSYSTPNISDSAARKPSPPQPIRNKSNLLAAFRLWFNEERKGKRKEDPNGAGTSHAHATGSTRVPSRRGSMSKPPTMVSNKNKSGGSKYSSTRGTKHRAKRPSMSSRRSSSVNSRRSSVTSNHIAAVLELDSPQPMPPRRSVGSHTPNSEFGGDHSSRPSSIHSLSMQQPTTATSARHRKSPSQSSVGSIHQFRTSSPMQKLYHRRGGSGSSTTRVVRQMTPVKEQRPPHVRSNSATSSLYSPPSSRPTSFYEQSESEGGGLNLPRTASPYRSRRRSTDDSSSIASNSRRNGGNGTTTFVAQKRQGPFASPAGIGRSSWKKSWGIEPPGWSSRTAHLPIEVIDILPSSTNEPISIRDVFSGKHPVHLTTDGAGDESDWVDEEDDIPAFPGGLGQLGTLSISSSLSSSTGSAGLHLPSLPALQTDQGPITLSPAPRGHRTKRSGSGGNGGRSTGPSSSAAGSAGSRSKAGHSPAPKVSPLPSESMYETTETRTGRRQLPTGRSGPAFRQAIQEEDEGEEE